MAAIQTLLHLSRLDFGNVGGGFDVARRFHVVGYFVVRRFSDGWVFHGARPGVVGVVPWTVLPVPDTDTDRVHRSRLLASASIWKTLIPFTLL